MSSTGVGPRDVANDSATRGCTNVEPDVRGEARAEIEAQYLCSTKAVTETRLESRGLARTGTDRNDRLVPRLPEVGHLRVSIVIPAYKRDRHDRRTRTPRRGGPGRKAIVLIDNVSTDGTREWIEGYPGQVTRILHERNEGKGASVRDGLAAATGDVAVIQDAVEYDPAQIPDLLARSRAARPRSSSAPESSATTPWPTARSASDRAC